MSPRERNGWTAEPFWPLLSDDKHERVDRTGSVAELRTRACLPHVPTREAERSTDDERRSPLWGREVEQRWTKMIR